MKDFELIVAMDLDGAIGNSKTNDIPWHLPTDFQHFKATTLGKTVVMGRRTWESLPFKPLKERRNVVISSQPNIEGAHAQYSTLKECLEKEENVVIIGGAALYQEALTYGPSTLHLTIVDLITKGDVHYPCEGNDMLIFGSFRVGDHTFINIRSSNHEDNKVKFTIQEWRRMPLPKLTTERYSYTVDPGPGNSATVTLIELPTGKVKEFYKADGHIDAYLNLMNSLTDEQCESFFGGNSKRKKGKKNG